MAADGVVRDAEVTKLEAILSWGAYVLSEHINVKSVFRGDESPC